MFKSVAAARDSLLFLKIGAGDGDLDRGAGETDLSTGIVFAGLLVFPLETGFPSGFC